MKSVAVITPTTGKISNLTRSLNSVAEQDYLDPVKHYVIGDHLNVQKAHEVEESCKAVDAIFLNYTEPVETRYEPARIGRIRNYGIQNCTEDFIAHLDDDNKFEKDHISSLCHLLINNVKFGIAHSWRKILNQDGSDCLLERYPWVIQDNEVRSKEVFELLTKNGIFEKSSPIVKDRIISLDDDLHHIDSSEWLMRREIFDLIQFQESYTPREMIYQYTDDYMFCKQAIEHGIKFICSEKATLNYYLGGYHAGESNIVNT